MSCSPRNQPFPCKFHSGPRNMANHPIKQKIPCGARSEIAWNGKGEGEGARKFWHTTQRPLKTDLWEFSVNRCSITGPFLMTKNDIWYDYLLWNVQCASFVTLGLCWVCAHGASESQWQWLPPFPHPTFKPSNGSRRCQECWWHRRYVCIFSDHFLILTFFAYSHTWFIFYAPLHLPAS